MTQGGISSWNVKEGDAVQPGDVLAQVDVFWMGSNTIDLYRQEHS